MDGPDGDIVVGTIFHADGQYQDESCDKYIARALQVNLLLHQIAHTHCRNHAIKYQADTTDGSRRHQLYQTGEFRTECQYDSQTGC